MIICVFYILSITEDVQRKMWCVHDSIWGADIKIQIFLYGRDI